MSATGPLRFRLYLGGDLIKDETVELAGPDDLEGLAMDHSTMLMNFARMTGKKWLVEVELLQDPSDPERFLRFGTDSGGMVDPQANLPWLR